MFPANFKYHRVDIPTIGIIAKVASIKTGAVTMIAADIPTI